MMMFVDGRLSCRDGGLAWGSEQTNKNGSHIVMPGGGEATEGAWTDAERAELANLADRHELDLDTLLVLVDPAGSGSDGSAPSGLHCCF
ncbi:MULTISPECIES: hypothetical protein [unclassified Sphingobium]|uniref:hypothetical protein n=1 Tax=unclassified Sphingobium TaxID=2611147 RepID=UPI00119F36C4|nr:MULTISPECIES: hypothetical protein [unclassified Sphingobium]NML89088.1 hypothetical protein [Sphingobium sp. TB-6]